MVTSWVFKHSKSIARALKMLRAKTCGYNSVLNSEDHATVPHRMEHPEVYCESINAQDSELANAIHL